MNRLSSSAGVECAEASRSNAQGPDSGHAGCGRPAGLLGRIIDRLAGESFTRSQLSQRQFDVAGMTRTVFGDDHDVVPHSARTYTPYLVVDGRRRRTDVLYKVHTEFPPMLRTCGGMNSTAEDIARWLIALQRGELLRRRSSLLGLRTALPLNDGIRRPRPLLASAPPRRRLASIRRMISPSSCSRTCLPIWACRSWMASPHSSCRTCRGTDQIARH